MLRTMSADEARRSLLQRNTFDDFQISDALQASITEMFGEPLTPEQVVARILRDVRERGDDALRKWTAKLDHVEIGNFRIPLAYSGVDADLLEAMELAANRIRAFHEKQPVQSWLDSRPEGTLGQLIRPMGRVGIYVPGGTAPLFSSLLMSAIPARVVGVEEIVACTPPGPDGKVPDIILAAAEIAGVDAVFSVGGAQAVGAMAYGTETIPRVDMIAGPGNLFVIIAKRQVFGLVGIDGLPGPTETVVIADANADPAYAAADLLAQAEHIMASAILLTPSKKTAIAVEVEIRKQLEQRQHADNIREALEMRGGLVLVQDMAEAFALANLYAPEHLCLLVENPWQYLGLVKNAGGVFLGEGSFEVLGDYVAGPSHIMPTGGTARFASPVNVLDFVKITSLVGLDPVSARELNAPAALLAEAENLDAHAAAAKIRMEKDEGEGQL